jgi:hypothetical protein
MITRAFTRAGRAGAVLCVALLGAASPRPAAAQTASDVESARAYFVEGTKLAGEGRWKEARESYARSLQLKPASITRYSLGVAQKETGHFAEALGSFRAFLADPPTSGTAAYQAPARTAIAALEDKVGRVVILVEPQPVEGLTLSIDGQPAPPVAERPRLVDPGGHEVVAHAPGFTRASGWFNVASGGSAAVTLTLVRLPSAGLAVAAAPGAPGSPVDPHRRADRVGPLAPHDPDAPAAPDRTGPVVLMSVGGGVFAIGLAVGLAGVTQASHAPTSNGDDASAARTKGIAGDVLGGLGIATAAVGLGWLIAQRRGAPAQVGAATVSVSRSGLGLSF